MLSSMNRLSLLSAPAFMAAGLIRGLTGHPAGWVVVLLGTMILFLPLAIGLLAERGGPIAFYREGCLAKTPWGSEFVPWDHFISVAEKPINLYGGSVLPYQIPAPMPDWRAGIKFADLFDGGGRGLYLGLTPGVVQTNLERLRSYLSDPSLRLTLQSKT